MLCLRLEAPFAVFRTFAAGTFRPTAEFITPSAAYGLLLNVAGIEIRSENVKGPVLVIKSHLPCFRLALGALEWSLQHSIFQQLHNYSATTDEAKKLARLTSGQKHNITPVRRSFLSNLKACICMDGDLELEGKVLRGLKGDIDSRYGLPFLGDNNFLIDKLQPLSEVPQTFWYERLDEASDEGPAEHTTRLTISIDRADMSKTRSALFTPCSKPTTDIPAKAWVQVGYP